MDALDRFLERRLTGVGSSDAPIIVGLGYIAAAELWEQKRGLIPAQDETEVMRIGTMLEPSVATMAAERIAKRLDVERIRLSARNRFRRRPGEPWQFAHVDRWHGTIPVELKVPQWTGGEWGPEDEGERGVAIRYRPQVQHQLLVTGAPFAWVFAFLPNTREPERLYRVERNDEQIAVLDDAERDFWRHVQDGTPVPVDGSESSARYLKRAHPVDDGSTLIATAEQRLVAAELFEAQARMKAAEREFEDRKAKLRQAMGDAAVLIGPDFEVTNRTYDRAVVEWEQIATAYRRVIEVAVDADCDHLVIGSGPVVEDEAGWDHVSRDTLDAVQSLYTRVEKSRRFMPTRRKEGAK